MSIKYSVLALILCQMAWALNTITPTADRFRQEQSPEFNIDLGVTKSDSLNLYRSDFQTGLQELFFEFEVIDDIFKINPNSLTPGSHFFTIENTQDPSDSLKFETLILSDKTFEMLSPVSGKQSEELPVLKWNGPDGVQLWRWFISDKAIAYNEITKQYEGQIFKEGWSSTPYLDLAGTSLLQNGDLAFIRGQKYFYSIFPAYGPQENLVDYQRVLINSFQYGLGLKLNDSLQWIYPTQGDTLDATLSEINFLRWSRTNEADQYLIRVFKPVKYGNMLFSQSLHEFFTTDTFSQFNFHNFSYSDSVSLSVAAYANGQLISESNIDAFVKQKNVQLTLDPLPFNTQVHFESLNSKSPLYFDRFEDSKFNIPQGQWNIKLINPLYHPIIISGQFYKDTTLQLQFEKITSHVEGQILDENQLPFPGAKIIFENAITNVKTSAISGSQGYFKSSLTPSLYHYYSINKNGITSTPIELEIQSGELLSIGKIIVKNESFLWKSQLFDESNQPLNSVPIQIQRADGSFLTQTQTTPEGKVEIELGPGQFNLLVKSSKFENKTIPINVPQSIIENHIIKKSIFEIKGSTIIESWVAKDSTLKQVIPNHLVYAFSTGQDTIWSQTNKNGEFKFQIPAKQKWIIGSEFNSRKVEVTDLNIDFNQRNIIFKNKSRIIGSLSSVSSPANEIVALAFTEDKRVHGHIFEEQGIWKYLFEDLDEGDYSIQVSTNTAVAISSTPITIFKNQAINQYLEFIGPTLTLNSSQVNTSFSTTLNGFELTQAKIYIQSPSPQIRNIQDTLLYAPALYTLAIIPENSDVIPIDSIFIQRGSELDSNLIFDFQDTHSPQDQYEFTGNNFVDELNLVLNYQNIPDSAFIYYRWNNTQWNQQKITDFQNNQANIPLSLNLEGFLNLEYYFVIYRENQIATNKTYGKKFHSKVNVSKSNWIIYPLAQDTLKMPLSTQINLQLKLYDQKGINHDISNHALDSFVITKKSNENWIVELDSLTKAIKITSPKHKDTLALTLQLSWHADTILWQKNFINKEILSNELVLNIRPKKAFYFPGDTLEISSELIDQINPTLRYNPGQIISMNNDSLMSNQFIIPDQYIGPIKINAKWNQISTFQDIEVIGIIPVNNFQKIFIRDSVFQLIIRKDANQGTADIPIRLRGDLRDSSTWAREARTVLEGPFAIHYPFSRALDSMPIIQYQKDSDIESLYLRNFNDSSYLFLEIDSSEFTDTPIWTFPTAAKTKAYKNTDDQITWLLKYQWPVFFDISKQASQGKKPFISITPNPFSPDVIASHDGNNELGTRIDFLPSAPQGNKAIVTINIYNMAGELVKRLIKREVFPQVIQNIYWDGRTDSGRLARNGRYLIFFESGAIHQRSKRAKIIQSVVVFR